MACLFSNTVSYLEETIYVFILAILSPRLFTFGEVPFSPLAQLLEGTAVHPWMLIQVVPSYLIVPQIYLCILNGGLFSESMVPTTA